jgi:hypothetical protein
MKDKYIRTPVELVTRDGKINKSGDGGGGRWTIPLPGENILCRERRISIACQPICHLHDDATTAGYRYTYMRIIIIIIYKNHTPAAVLSSHVVVGRSMQDRREFSSRDICAIVYNTVDVQPEMT